MYDISPNNPKKKELIALPTTPPIPKLEMKNITQNERRTSIPAS
jgi:hypothetical protein